MEGLIGNCEVEFRDVGSQFTSYCSLWLALGRILCDLVETCQTSIDIVTGDSKGVVVVPKKASPLPIEVLVNSLIGAAGLFGSVLLRLRSRGSPVMVR